MSYKKSSNDKLLLKKIINQGSIRTLFQPTIDVKYNPKTFPIGKISRDDMAINVSCKGKDIKEIFDLHMFLGIVIIDNNNYPVGLVMKSKFNSMLAMLYGNAIYLNRGIELIMDKSPLIVDYSTPLVEVSSLAMSREEEKLYDYIIVTKDNKYHGIVTIKKLLEYTTEIQLNYARHLNPLTGLPGNIIIENTLKSIIENKMNSSIIYIDLDNFKAYNDIYGFENGDKIIKLTADILYNTTYKHYGNSASICHIGGDDFVIIVENSSSSYSLTNLCENIIKCFDESIIRFYNEEHVKKGYITSTDRCGNITNFNIVSLSLSVITGYLANFETSNNIAELASKIKKQCKIESKSNFIIKYIDKYNCKL